MRRFGGITLLFAVVLFPSSRIFAAGPATSATSPAASTSPASAASTQRAAKLANQLLPMVQEVAKVDAPGADSYASALAAVLKKHGADVPADLLKAKPSDKLPKLSEEQVRAWAEANVIEKFETKAGGWADMDMTPADGALRVDMVEAVAMYAPTIGDRCRALETLAKWSVLTQATPMPRALIVDPKRSASVGKALVLECLSAATDGRDDFTGKTMGGLLIVRAAQFLPALEMMSLDDLTDESAAKVAKSWEEALGAYEKDSTPEGLRKVVALLREGAKKCGEKQIVDMILATREGTKTVTAFIKALDARDVEKMKALLMPKIAQKIEADKLDEILESMAAKGAKNLRVLRTGWPSSSQGMPIEILWTDSDGKEKSKVTQLPLTKTDAGWKIGIEQ